jgi:hypothetical protein
MSEATYFELTVKIDRFLVLLDSLNNRISIYELELEDQRAKSKIY